MLDSRHASRPRTNNKPRRFVFYVEQRRLAAPGREAPPRQIGPGPVAAVTKHEAKPGGEESATTNTGAGPPDRGSRAKASGSLDRGRGVTPRATDPSGNYTSSPVDILPVSDKDPGAQPILQFSGSPSAELFTPLAPQKPVDPGQNQAPSARWAGRDPKTGKVLPHKRSDRIAVVVAEYAAAGLGKSEIACLLNIRPGHLEHCYYRELHNGVSQTIAEVAGAMIKRAKDPSLEPTAQRAGEFFLQAKAGWRTGDSKQVLDVPMLNINIHL